MENPNRDVDIVASVWSMIPLSSRELIVARSLKLRGLLEEVNSEGPFIEKALRTLACLPQNDERYVLVEAPLRAMLEERQELESAADSNAIDCVGLTVLIDFFRRWPLGAEFRQDPNVKEVIATVRRLGILDSDEQLVGSYVLHRARSVVDIGGDDEFRFCLVINFNRHACLERVARVLRSECVHRPVFPPLLQQYINELDQHEFLSLDYLANVEDGVFQGKGAKGQNSTTTAGESNEETTTMNPADPMKQVAKGEPKHSLDFHSVTWGGEVFKFTAMQAACLKVLWEAWENGTPIISESTVLEEAGSHGNRLRDVFGKGKHPAWGKMICHKKGKDGFWLGDCPG